MQYEIKKDKFTRTRGGTSQLLLIYCSSCSCPIALYQKDGPGNLLRLYLDKILALSDVEDVNVFFKNSIPPNLKCKGCQKTVGNYFIYKPERRHAYRLIQGSIRKEISKGIFPPQDLVKEA